MFSDQTPAVTEVEGEAEEAASSCNAFELFQDCHFCFQTRVQPQGRAGLLVPLLFKPAPRLQIQSHCASSHWCCLEQDCVFMKLQFCCLTPVCPALCGGVMRQMWTSHSAMKKEQSCSWESSACHHPSSVCCSSEWGLTGKNPVETCTRAERPGEEREKAGVDQCRNRSHQTHKRLLQRGRE